VSDSQLLTTTWSSRPQATRQIIQFGGLTIPGIGGTLSYIDLNDGATWYVEDYEPSGDHISLAREQLTWQAQGAWTGTDFLGGRTITLTLCYDETTTPLSRALAQLAMAGEQYLTFDTHFGIRCKYSGYTEHSIENATTPYVRKIKMTFMTRDPWAEDLSGNTVTSTISFNSDTAGTTAHNIAITYDGSVFTKPILYLTTDGAVQSVAYSNANEVVTITGASSSTGATTTTIDSNNFRILENGIDLPPSGTFPMLYPGTQTFHVYVRASSTRACTAYISYLRRFEIH